jgi:hypothetical protein
MCSRKVRYVGFQKYVVPINTLSISLTSFTEVQSILVNICSIQKASGGVGGSPKQELKRVPAPIPAPIEARGSFVSGIGAPTYTPKPAGVTTTTTSVPTSTSPPATTSTTAPASSSPSVVLSSPGNKLQAGGVAFVAALLALMV